MPKDTIKTRLYGYYQTLSTVLRLFLNKQISWRKTRGIAANTLACLMKRPPPYFPPALQVDITNTCNLRCQGCLTGQGLHRKAPGMMALDGFRALIDEVKNETAIVALYNSGEPMLNPAVFDMVTCLTQNRIASIISTNGHFIDTRKKAERLVTAGLSLLIVSISGATQETYGRYHRGGHLAQVIKSIALITEAKKRMHKPIPLITLRILATEDNANELPKMRALARALGCDAVDIRYAEWQKQVVKRQLDNRPPQAPRMSTGKRDATCLWPWLISVVNWDGDVTPCCFYHLPLPVLGNVLKDGGMRQVWHGPAYNDFRKTMQQGKAGIGPCRDCPAEIGFQTRFTRQNIK